MATLTVRNVPDDGHKGLRLRAAQNGRSVEEEIRRILAEQVTPDAEYRNPKTPEEIAELPASYTGRYLKPLLKR